MADRKAAEEKPKKPQGTRAAGGPEEEAEKSVKTKAASSSNGGESSVAALRRDQLKKLQTLQQTLQRSPSLDSPQSDDKGSLSHVRQTWTK